MTKPDDSTGQPNPLRARVIAGRIAWSTLFTVTELWAITVVLTQPRVSTVQAAALAFIVAGVVLVMWSEWHEVGEVLRRYNRSRARPSGTTTGEMSTDLA